MEWTDNINQSWFHLTHNGFKINIFIYLSHTTHFVYICRSIGIEETEALQATTLPAAKAEALTLVTARLKEIVKQLENAPLK